jgi:flagellin
VFQSSGAAQRVTVRFLGAGLAGPIDLELDTVSGSTTVAQVVADLSSKVSANSQLQTAGITLDAHASAAALTLRSKHGEQFEVQVSGDTGNRLGLGTFRSANAVTGGFDYTTIDGAGATFAAGTTQTLEFSISGGATQSLTIAAGEAGTVAAAIAYLNDEIQANATLRAAGLVASDTGGGQIRIASANGTYFRVNGLAAGATNQLGFGVVGVTSAANYASTLTSKHTFNAGGSSNSALGTSDEVFNWTALRNGSDDQTVSFTTTDASGAEHSLAVVLRNDSTLRNAVSLDDAVDAINTALQQSNDSYLKQIVAVKEHNSGSSAEGIRFLSTGRPFKVSVGTTANDAGIRDNVTGGPTQGAVHTSEVSSGGSTSAIDTQSGAESAVTALASAVSLLGESQAVVGKGQNNFSFAINLAQTQLTNLAAAESRIRDADLAAEAANLTKAQILQQAGVAALAQANSAPQIVLSLLRG